MFGKIQTWAFWCLVYRKLHRMLRLMEPEERPQLQWSIFLKVFRGGWPHNMQKPSCWMVLMAPWLVVESATVVHSLLVTACVCRSGSVGARWRLWHVPMWGMFSARPPRTASPEERARSSTKTTGVWLKSGWTISKNSSILSHQVEIRYRTQSSPLFVFESDL